MIRIAMCDDETMFLQTYQKKVSELFQEHNVDCKIDTYTDARRFLEDCEKTSYDLIFLDIDMPGLSGIQLASKFRDKGLDTTLVFVSSHDDFVFETFRYNAYRFVRKNKLISDTQEMISSFCAGVTPAITSRRACASPAITPAHSAAAIPRIPPVFGTITLFTFLIMFPLTWMSSSSGRQPRVSLATAPA